MGSLKQDNSLVPIYPVKSRAVGRMWVSLLISKRSLRNSKVSKRYFVPLEWPIRWIHTPKTNPPIWMCSKAPTFAADQFHLWVPTSTVPMVTHGELHETVDRSHLPGRVCFVGISKVSGSQSSNASWKAWPKIHKACCEGNTKMYLYIYIYTFIYLLIYLLCFICLFI